ncbi:MAG TPA: hypothetical protein VJ302_26895 [Blastocatellia bacterium]|nr:hypothetical protein [Blastocatellia bacterium]
MAMAPAPRIRKSLADYLQVEQVMAEIGAVILDKDEEGPTMVEWNGQIFKRRAPDNKYNPAIWYSRCTGKAEDGANQYATLIQFGEIKADVDPLGTKAKQALAKLTLQRPTQPTTKHQAAMSGQAPLTASEDPTTALYQQCDKLNALGVGSSRILATIKLQTRQSLQQIDIASLSKLSADQVKKLREHFKAKIEELEAGQQSAA